MSIEAAIINACIVVVLVAGGLFAIGWAHSYRISKGDTRCRECGSPMVDQYPHSVGARRHYICNVCGYFDSYIDCERVRKAQEHA